MKLRAIGLRRPVVVLVSAFVLVPLLLTGCGPGQGKVSGRVLYNGVPVPGGRVTFCPADSRQNSVSAELDEQGNYEAVLPAGEVKVCVDNRELEPPPPGGGAVMPPGLPPDVIKAMGGGKREKAEPQEEHERVRPSGRYVRIPEAYYDVETSGLAFKVERGEQKHNLELK